MTPDELLARVLYRDGLMLIVDKPAGLPVHAGPKGGATLEDLFDHLRFGLPRAPALAHRLDRDTSGCLVLGRHAKALRRLGKLFSQGKVRKTYWAVVEGTPPQRHGTIVAALRKRNAQRGWWMEIHEEGQAAVTDYRLLASAGGRSWLELHPRTGRTHQIRVHCASLGCPVVGEPIYGAEPGPQQASPLHLHARAVSLPLYPTRDPVGALAAPPAHMLAALAALGWTADVKRGPAPA